jgi:hypothetical protein
MKIGAAPAVLLAGALFACAPAPDAIELSSRPDRTNVPQPLDKSLVEGDLLVIDAIGVDSGDRTELCVTAVSSDPSVVEVLPARGDCQVFILLARQPGHARVSFTAREVTSYAEIDVAPAP